MIQAKIISLSPVQVEYVFEYHPEVGQNEYAIAYVENVELHVEPTLYYHKADFYAKINGGSYLLKIGTSCFIELTRDGKCEIVKL